MKRFYAVALATLASATTLLLLPTDADAANVRRHLKCDSLQLPSVSFLTQSPERWGLIITNTWNLTIPKGTTFTVTVDRRSSAFKSTGALSQGQSTIYGAYGSKPQSCSVTVPG